VRAWGQQELVGQAAAVGGEDAEPVALGDQPLARRELRLEVSADGAAVAFFLGHDCGRRLLQPGELRVAVSEAGAGLAPLVQQRVDVGEACCTRGARPLAPGQRDAGDLVVAKERT